jgi:hypothetical protein
MKVTEPGLNKLIDNLNTLICEDSLLTRQERETLVLAVAAIGAMKARVGLKKAMRRPLPDGKKGEKDRQPDPRFPRAGHPWQEDEKTLLSDALDSVPDEEIGRHLSGFPRNWAERLSVLLSRSRQSGSCRTAGRSSSGRFRITFACPA